MTRSYSVSQIIQSAGVGQPAKIVLSALDGNVTPSFKGRYYRNSVGLELPAYTIPAPIGYSLIAATSFDIIDNPSYNGHYTVYTPGSNLDPSGTATFDGVNTTILLNELIGIPLNIGDDLIGKVINISTYVIAIEGEADLYIPPTAILEDRPLSLVGKNGKPWGEIYSQNLVKLAQNFANGSAPSNPYLGQMWFDSITSTLKLYDGSTWNDLTISSSGGTTSYRFTQLVAASTWNVVHNLGLTSPFVCLVQVFVDRGVLGHKMILPSDITFNNTNQLTITFTSAETGVVLIRE